MNKAFEKIIDELKQESIIVDDDAGHRAVEIIEQIAAEYNNGWIACSDRLPEESGEYLVTSKIYFVPDHVDEIDNYVGVKISHYSTRCGWLDDEVMAWQPLPEPFKECD